MEWTTATYGRLKEVAASVLRNERGRNGVRRTSLANEAYLRLRKVSPLLRQDDRATWALAALAMKRILINLARERGSLKRGGHVEKVSITDGNEPLAPEGPSLVEIEDAIEALRKRSARRARVVELVLAGHTLEEVASVLGVSVRLVGEEWREGRSWLAERLKLQH